MPENLEYLRLSHCKMPRIAVSNLLETIRDKCFLRKLELVKIGLYGDNVEQLSNIVKQSRSITHFDISWNHFVPDDMVQIIDVLSKNRRL